MSEESNAVPPIDMARGYLARGLSVVPIPPKSKAPRAHGWQKMRLRTDDLPNHFTSRSNIGVLLGEPSGGLVDIDLDHPLAVELADRFLPTTTSEFGRKSKPRSHRLYRLAVPVATKKWKTRDEKMIVERRSTGTQTLFPGSVHPSGEAIQWHVDGDPTVVEPDDLNASLEALTAEVLRRLGELKKRTTNEEKTAASNSVHFDTLDRARKYLAKIPPAVSGQGGHSAAFHAACQMVLGFKLGRQQALDLLSEWNKACQPPWSERELAHKVDDALRQPGERGYLLPSNANTKHHAVRPNTKRRATTANPTAGLIDPYSPLPDVLPEPVRSFVAEAARAIGCDSSFIALPTLACLARAIGNTRVIQLKPDWQEYAIIWAAIVGKSGTHKTPAMQKATEVLHGMQAQAFAEHQAAMDQYAEDLALYERDAAAWKKAKDNSEPPPVKPVEPVCRRYICSDVTIEALATLLEAQFDGVLVVRDELAGWIGGIAEYKGGKGSDTGHWLATWSAQPMTVDRKTGAKRTLHIPRASVSIVGGIQPGILAEAMRREHMQDGMCARILLAMPEPKPVSWTEAEISQESKQAMRDLYTQLLTLEPVNGTDEKPGAEPVVLTLTPEAKQIWVAYYNRHRHEMTSLDDDLASANSKLEAYTARFALIFQLVSWAAGDAQEEAIDELAMRAAIELSDWFAGEARRVYCMFGETDEDRDARRLVQWISGKGGSVMPRDVQMGCRWLSEPGEAEKALEGLSKAGAGRWENIPTTSKGGRPARVFRLVNNVNINTTHDFSVNGEVVLTVDTLTRPSEAWQANEGDVHRAAECPEHSAASHCEPLRHETT